VGRPKQNLPRKLAGAGRTQASSKRRQSSRSRLLLHIPVKTPSVLASIASLMVVTIVIGVSLAAFGESSQAARQHRIQRNITTMLAGIPQDGNTLGKADAPYTLQVFADLEDHDSRRWFTEFVPQIIQQLVRPGILKIQYRSFKTDTIWPTIFVNQQTAALAAGAQARMWNYIETFYNEQGIESTPYATEKYLNDIAVQIPGLNLSQWHQDRQDGRRSEQVAADDHLARTLGLIEAPSFLIGHTGQPLHRAHGSYTFIDAGKKHSTNIVALEDILAYIKTQRQGHRSAR
jgi:Thioredoxin